MLIDAHAHLDGYDELGRAALEAALEEIESHRIVTIANSMDPASYRRNLELAARSKRIIPIFGIHPWNAHKLAGSLADLDREMDESPLYGEVGLDHFFVKDASRYPAQEKVFRFFLDAARERGKAVIIHTKGAEAEALAVLDEFRLPRVIIHWYSGPIEVFRELAARGCYFTVGSEVIRSKHIQTIASEIALDRLLTESDNPGGPKSVTGRPGTPLIIRDVLVSLSKARGMAEEGVERAIQENLLRMCVDDPHLARLQAMLE